MLTGIISILGMLAGVAPGVLQYMSLRANNAQAVAIEQLRIQAAKDGVALQVDLERARADTEQQRRVYDFASAPSGIKWVDALAVFVRPYITLIMFHAWIALEALLLVYGIANGVPLEKMATMLWSEDVQGMFAAIVGFWFGDRAIGRRFQQMAATVAVNQPNVVQFKPKATSDVAKRMAALGPIERSAGGVG